MASELSKCLKKAQNTGTDQRETIKTINSLQRKLSQQGDDLHSWQYLKQSYEKLYEQAVDELCQADACVVQIQDILWRRESKMRKRESSSAADVASPAEDDPVLDGAQAVADEYRDAQRAARAGLTGDEIRSRGDIWYHEDIVLPPGTQVAAMTDNNSRPRIWIQAIIRTYSPAPGRPEWTRYEVLDEDEGNEENPNPVRKSYSLHPSRIIPLPSLEDVPLPQRKIFAKHTRILAVWPGSTTLYPCNVVHPPGKKSKDQYHVTFDDDDEEVRAIHCSGCAPLADDFYE